MNRIGLYQLGTAIIAAIIIFMTAPYIVSVPVSAAGDTYYVSKTGSNSDGSSWATAWNELDQIDWNSIQAGDTILIDGGSSECNFPVSIGQTNSPGSSCGMVYESTLTIGKSGQSGNPITVKLAEEPGRNGTVRIFGGRSTPLPYCGQTGYSFQSSGVRSIGVVFAEDRSWVVLDGVKWAGIMIYGHNRNGVRLYPSSNRVTVRNVEIYDNGTAQQSGSTWSPDLPGVDLIGSNVIFEEAIVHDNGQDAFQSPGNVVDFKLYRSWLHNSRPHPANPTRSYNECRHTDGIQLYGGGLNSNNILIQDSIIGPGFMQGVLLGDGGEPAAPWAVVNDVTIQNTLFFKSSNAEISSHTNPTNPTNWRIENVTTFAAEGRQWHNVYLEGTGHVFKDSVFYGGLSMTIPDGNPTTEGNCQWKVGGRSVGQAQDPQFADVDENDWFSLDDFTVQNAACKGSSIGSVAQLLGESAPTATPTSPSPTATSEPTATSTATPEPTATATTPVEPTPPEPTPVTPSPTTTQTTSPTGEPPTPVPTTPVPPPEDLIIDDVDPGFTTAFAQDVWNQFRETGGQHYGGTHYFNHQIGQGQDAATWAFEVAQPGRFNVYAWWYEGSWRPVDVPYTVHHAQGASTVRVNQQIDGGQWNFLGTFEFRDLGSIVISDDVTSGEDIAADAIRLEFAEPLPQPPVQPAAAWSVYIPFIMR